MNIQQDIASAPAAQAFVTAAYHSPSVAVVVPHFNYSEFLGDALLSVQQQNYGNFTCIVVDDGSSPDHFEVVQAAVSNLADSRFSIIRSPDNHGQVHAIFKGIERTSAQFLAVLDPDDRYTPGFLERMVRLHLHPKIFCPVVSCDQYLMPIGEGITTATHYSDGLSRMGTEEEAREEATYEKYGFHNFYPPLESSWVWATTSSFLFRTEALRLLKPQKALPYKGQGDAWYANGAHMLGGTIMLREPLVYRGLHTRNEFIRNSIFSMWQRTEREGVKFLSDEVKIDVVEAFLQNGGLAYFHPESLIEVISAHFRGPHLAKLLQAVPELHKLMMAES